MANASRYTTLAQRCFQCYLGRKPRAVHREYIGWCGDKILGEEIDGGFDAIGQLRASKVKPTDNLQPILRAVQSSKVIHMYHVNWSRKPLDRIFDNVHDACVRATVCGLDPMHNFKIWSIVLTR